MAVAATWDGTTDKSYSGTIDTLTLSSVTLANIVDITSLFSGTYVVTANTGHTLTFSNTTAAALETLLSSATAFNTNVLIGANTGVAIPPATVASAVFGGSGDDTITGSVGNWSDTLNPNFRLAITTNWRKSWKNCRKLSQNVAM